MKKIIQSLTNICSDKLTENKDFYTKRFDFNVGYDSGWFVHLSSKDNQFELGIIDRKNEIVPFGYRNNPQGFYITFVAENVDDVFEIAKSEKIEILSDPNDTFYGQHRLLLKDPNGALVDVSSPTAPSS